MECHRPSDYPDKLRPKPGVAKGDYCTNDCTTYKLKKNNNNYENTRIYINKEYLCKKL